MFMEWKEFELDRSGSSFLVNDSGFRVGLDFDGSVDIQLLTSDVVGSGTVFVGPEGVDVDADFEPLRPGEVVDIYSVLIKALPGDKLSYWFSIGSRSFYFSSCPGEKEGLSRLENEVDVAFLSASKESVREAVVLKPGLVIPYEGEMNINEFVAELEDRNINCQVM